MAWHLALRGSASVELRDDRAVPFEEQVAWEIVVSHQITYLVAHHCPLGYPERLSLHPPCFTDRLMEWSRPFLRTAAQHKPGFHFRSSHSCMFL